MSEKTYKIKDFADIFGVSKTSINNWLTTLNIEPLRTVGDKKVKVYDEDALKRLKNEHTFKDMDVKLAKDIAQKRKDFDHDHNQGNDTLYNQILEKLDQLDNFDLHNILDTETISDIASQVTENLIQSISERDDTYALRSIVNKLDRQLKALKRRDDQFENLTNKIFNLTSKIDKLQKSVDGQYETLKKNIKHVNYDKLGEMISKKVVKKLKNDRSIDIDVTKNSDLPF